MMHIKNIIIGVCTGSLLACVSCGQHGLPTVPDRVLIGKDSLMDKIKGGWAGQVIGCTYGGPTEFRFCGTMIQDYVPLTWPEGQIKWYYDNSPGLYDDVYMDLTFVELFDRLGLDAPTDSFAVAFAYADYPLWHANQAARYNIMHGVMPPASGHWLNNPHADDIDFQIEADFAGLMSPGMPNAASAVSDRIGHIMNYGDGWYGGVYVAAMYSLAFVSNDLQWIVAEALKTIPQQSSFYQCMNDIIGWHRQYPNDWKQTWFECERKWTSEAGCPDGVFLPFDIDALINSAYIVIGLLYGEGDFGKSIDIATRCGQDSDCNPASVGGILGTMLGYNRIPEQWRNPLKEVEERDFAYTRLSLNKTYRLSFEQALQMIERNGGNVSGNRVEIRCQQPTAVRYEKCFEGIKPSERLSIRQNIGEATEVAFAGTGIVLTGNAVSSDNSYVAQLAVYLDGTLNQTVELPVSFIRRRYDLYWNYQLPEGKHRITFKWLNPNADSRIWLNEAVVYVNDKLKETN